MTTPYQAIGLVPTIWGIRRRDEIAKNLEHLEHLTKAAFQAPAKTFANTGVRRSIPGAPLAGRLACPGPRLSGGGRRLRRSRFEAKQTAGVGGLPLAKWQAAVLQAEAARPEAARPLKQGRHSGIDPTPAVRNAASVLEKAWERGGLLCDLGMTSRPLLSMRQLARPEVSARGL